MTDLLHNRKALIIGGVVLFLIFLVGFLSSFASNRSQTTNNAQTGQYTGDQTSTTTPEEMGGTSPTPIFTIIDPDKPMFKVEPLH